MRRVKRRNIEVTPRDTIFFLPNRSVADPTQWEKSDPDPNFLLILFLADNYIIFFLKKKGYPKITAFFWGCESDPYWEKSGPDPILIFCYIFVLNFIWQEKLFRCRGKKGENCIQTGLNAWKRYLVFCFF